MIKTSIFLFMLFFSVSRALCQDHELPNLADNIIVCFNGALPYYTSCDDSPCKNEYLDSSGKISAKGKCNKAQKTGLWNSYYPNGNIMSSGIIKDALLYGTWQFFHENGHKKAVGEFRIGVYELGCAGSENFTSASIMNGEWSFWDENETLQVVCNFSPNEQQEETLHGSFTSFYRNGNKKEEGVYFKGMKNGIWTYWFQNGKKEKTENYLYKDCDLFDYIWFECPTGTWQYWNEDGSLWKEEHYQNGAKVD